MPAALAKEKRPQVGATGGALFELLLRPDLVIARGADDVVLRFAHWELCLPVRAVAADAEVETILTDRRASALPASRFARGLVALLDAQGCLLRTGWNRLTLRQVLQLIQPIRSQLYASYYAHPLWGLLARGEASRGQLTAWVIHNYHISRSAGVIAARMATRFRDDPLGSSFRKDALDEYWHFDQFYFVRHPWLTLDVDACKRYVALPGSLAFEEQALRAASEDGLGHLLIAYFQESSVIFRGDSEAFYDKVECNYGLDGFFRGWRRHLSLDADQGHAESLAGLFSSEIEVTRDEFVRALRSLQLAHFSLLAALDQVHECDGDATEAIAMRQPERVIADLSVKSRIDLDSAALDILVDALRESSFNALAHARSHDEIMAAGRLAAELGGDPRSSLGSFNPWLEAVYNFILERSRDGAMLFALTREAARLAAGSRGGGPAALRRAAQLAACPNSDPGAKLEYAQLAELLDLATRSVSLPPLAFDVASAG